MIDAKPLPVRFNKINIFIKVYDGVRCLVLSGTEKYDLICNRIRHFIGVKSGIKYVFSHNYAEIKNDS